MAIAENFNLVQGINRAQVPLYSLALVYDRAPTANDITELGRFWINETTGISYQLVAKTGSPLQATWVEIADATPDGTDGQLLIGRTGLPAAWANLGTDGSIGILEAAGAITLSVVGAVAAQYQTDAGNAAPLAGVTQFLGGANINTTGGVGAGNELVAILDDDVTLAGFLTTGTAVTAGVDLNMLAGACTIESNANAAAAIYLFADGGVLDTIEIYNDQGTDASSISILSDDGGIDIESGLSGAASIKLNASHANGGFDFDYGDSGFTIDGADGNFALVTGTGDIDIGIDATDHNIDMGSDVGVSSIIIDCGTGGAQFGTTATAHDTIIGSINTTSGTLIQSGSGDINLASSDAIEVLANGLINIDATTGILSLNAAGAAINVGNDDNDFAINIGTQGERVTTIGNIVGVSGLALNAGSGNIVVTATDSDISVISGTGDIKIGADATVKDIVIGAANGATGVDILAGSGDIDLTATLGSINLTSTEDTIAAIYLHANAGVAETIQLRSDQGTSVSSITLLSDDGGIVIDAGLAAANSITIDASHANGGIDCDYGDAGYTIDGADGAFTLVTGTGNISLGADATDHDVAIGSDQGGSSMTLTAGTNGLSLVPTGGNVDMVPATGTNAANTITLNAKLGSATFTGLGTLTGAQETFTITNSACTSAASVLFVTVTNIGAGDARMTMEQVKPAVGSFEVKTQNNGADTLNGDVVINWWIIA